MDHREAGQGTPFDSMTHEDMLAWLDKANSGAVQGASDRLVSAAKEIRKIAGELKVRPQMVEWKGQGADAFRTWSADLANATLRLGDYSDGASKWLAQASNAITAAQAATPRTTAGAQANLDAARAARNDPDASAVAQKSAETLIATSESNRQEAVAQMRKLAQSYSFSASQMDSLEKPAFPPPPVAIVPSAEERVDGERGFLGSTGGGEVARNGYVDGPATTGSEQAPSRHINPPEQLPSFAEASPATSGLSTVRPVDMAIDNVVMSPDAPAVSLANPGSLPGGGTRPEGSVAPPTGMVPPAFGVGQTGVSGPGAGARAAGAIRPPGMSGQGSAARMPRDGGITGGRPVPQNSGRPAGGLPRGTVVGGEGAQGRGPMGRGMGVAGPGAGQNGMVGGRRLAGEAGGIVGGRPQQPGRPTARPFTPGGSGLVREGNTGRATRGAETVGRGTGTAAPSSQVGRSRRDENGERPDYLTEDEETWQQGGRRVVPPVID